MDKQQERIFDDICNEVLDLNLHYRYLKGVFINQPGNNKDQILQKASPIFFDIAFHLFYDHVLLGIKKLSDPASQSGNENLSVLNLLAKLKPYPAAIAKNINAQEAILLDSSKNIKVQRDKRISHNDLNARLGITPLPHIEESEIDECLSALESLLNEISQHYKHEKINFTSTTPALNCDPAFLLEVLKKGTEL